MGQQPDMETMMMMKYLQSVPPEKRQQLLEFFLKRRKNQLDMQLNGARTGMPQQQQQQIYKENSNLFPNGEWDAIQGHPVFRGRRM